MKNYKLFAIVFVLMSCVHHKKPVLKNLNIDIACYRITSDTIDKESKYPLKINMQATYGDTIKFIYCNEGLRDYIDTLIIIKPDSVILENKLKFISQRAINFNGKALMIKKYRKKGEHYSLGNIYINDSLGIIIDRYIGHPSGQSLIMYNTGKLSELHHAIIKDSVFFAGEWFN